LWSSTSELEWTAVKISPHAHEPPSPGQVTDTERYRNAGAAHAQLIHSAADLPAALNLIVESNTILDEITPDLFVFVTDSAATEWKPSARRTFHLADVVVDREISGYTLRQIRDSLLRNRVP
jgi:hypothetical protein